MKRGSPSIMDDEDKVKRRKEKEKKGCGKDSDSTNSEESGDERGMKCSQIKSEEELQWKPELVWRAPPKPTPKLEDHPLLKSLPRPPQPSQQATTTYPAYLPPLYPNIPPPTLFMEPISAKRCKCCDVVVEWCKSAEAKAKKSPTTPRATSPISPHSNPSSGSATKTLSESADESGSREDVKVRETAAEEETPMHPRCTLHYFRRVRNAEEEGFHVIQGQVWHGRGDSADNGEERPVKRWRRHQWTIDG
jgi:hypothetical protein